MQPFTNFESRIVPLPINDVDTDQIIPARFLKTISKQGLDQQLFYDWRYDGQGRPKPDFILNQPRAKAAERPVVDHLGRPGQGPLVRRRFRRC